MEKLRVSLLVGLAIVLFFVAGAAFAEQHDRLTPLLVELEGWQAQPVQGTSMVSAQLKMITARRVYNKGVKGLVASLMVNSGPVMDSDLQESSTEDDVNKVTTRLLKGFWVTSTHNKKNNSGSIVVWLDYNEEANSSLVISYSSIGAEEALSNAKKFNWDAMKSAVSSML